MRVDAFELPQRAVHDERSERRARIGRVGLRRLDGAHHGIVHGARVVHPFGALLDEARDEMLVEMKTSANQLQRDTLLEVRLTLGKVDRPHSSVPHLSHESKWANGRRQ